VLCIVLANPSSICRLPRHCVWSKAQALGGVGRESWYLYLKEDGPGLNEWELGRLARFGSIAARDAWPGRCTSTVCIEPASPPCVWPCEECVASPFAVCRIAYYYYCCYCLLFLSRVPVYYIVDSILCRAHAPAAWPSCTRPHPPRARSAPQQASRHRCPLGAFRPLPSGA
jgi:hypothetical protein